MSIEASSNPSILCMFCLISKYVPAFAELNWIFILSYFIFILFPFIFFLPVVWLYFILFKALSLSKRLLCLLFILSHEKSIFLLLCLTHGSNVIWRISKSMEKSNKIMHSLCICNHLFHFILFSVMGQQSIRTNNILNQTH